MARVPRSNKRVKITVYKPRGKKQKAGSGMVVLAPTKTRRGKTVYTEVDAAPYYDSTDEEGDSSKRKPSKTPSHSRTAISAPLEDPFQWEASCLDDPEPHIPRITKVRP